MQKLLLLLTSAFAVTPAIGPLVQAKNPVLIENKNDLPLNEKIDIGDIQIKDYTFDTADAARDVDVVRQIALTFAAKASGNELAVNFISDFLANGSNYTVMGDITAIPGIGEVLNYNLIILATSTNPIYKGIIEFKITLINDKEMKSIDLSLEIKNIIENKLNDIELKKISDNEYIPSVLKFIDQKLKELEVPTFGHNDLLEWGYTTNQLSVKYSNIGDSTNNSGFYALNKFEISVIDFEFSHFKKTDDINFNVGRVLKDKISMSDFKDYAISFSKDSYRKYKVHSQGGVDIKNVLTGFDQFLYKNSNNANGQVFSQEYDRKALEVSVGDPVFSKENASLVQYQLTVTPTEKSKVFNQESDSKEGYIEFTITFLIDDIHLIPSDSINFSDGERIQTSWWGYQSYSGGKEYNLLKWSNYASNWEEFVDDYGMGSNKQNLKFFYSASVSTNWDKTLNSSTNGASVIALASITEKNQDKLDGSGYVDLGAQAGSSKLYAHFWTGFRHDDDYIILKVTFWLELQSFSEQYLALSGSITSVRFDK